MECREQAVMTQSHCINCPAWTEIRSGLDLSKISDMVVFLRKLLVERASHDSVTVESARKYCIIFIDMMLMIRLD